ncbi:molybdenum cofactor biosynthesis protein MoaE [Marinomonas mediterranea]|jgi:molybdopterin synthase subunit MoaE|uniref:Molybdopterin synthase catalytic subunit n=1 Tax=Marinomonas mediterranea (strain ATCC 700492 / JCM 21426 / NBRC 103028 / MMB-1) TaxID=717774 RepID=F2JU29_MARM1|nr:molybdenum cofactor biosynthesis protein MoaE [Marinomonas mediterranea]ADZ91541.1 molybdopterin biosynthesis MoaE protein [Marinomonas mediterranea MMB-1]WCN17646.1 molybdenum cofactor biosynthesis protein MoaE [Marinomonas mediterranea MMB-1]
MAYQKVNIDVKKSVKTVISVQTDDFSVADLYSGLSLDKATGGIAMFVGLVRDFAGAEHHSVAVDAAFELEHYPGMTEKNMASIVEEATNRWGLQAVTVVHRVGRLNISDQIVFVGASAAHRTEAFEACEYIMDYLKSRAAFWKKETVAGKGAWVEAKDHDKQSLDRWR